MADNFNLAKFLRNNRLLNEGIGGYKDIEPMREAESITDNEFKKGDLVRIKADQDYGNDEYMGVGKARFKDLKGQRLKVTGTDDGGKTVRINDVDSLPASYLELDDPKKNAPIRVTPDNEVGADDELGSSGWGISEADEGDEEQAYFDYKRSGEDRDISWDDFDRPEVQKYDRMMGLAHEEFMGISDIVSMTIDSLRHDGFDDQDILNFLATDFSLDEGLDEAEMGGEEFDWKPIDQQGKTPFKNLTVTITGDEMKVKSDDGFDSQSYTKDDIKDAMKTGEYLRFRGKNLELNTKMKAWANS